MRSLIYSSVTDRLKAFCGPAARSLCAPQRRRIDGDWLPGPGPCRGGGMVVAHGVQGSPGTRWWVSGTCGWSSEPKPGPMERQAYFLLRTPSLPPSIAMARQDRCAVLQHQPDSAGWRFSIHRDSCRAFLRHQRRSRLLDPLNGGDRDRPHGSNERARALVEYGQDTKAQL